MDEYEYLYQYLTEITYEEYLCKILRDFIIEIKEELGYGGEDPSFFQNKERFFDEKRMVVEHEIAKYKNIKKFNFNNN